MAPRPYTSKVRPTAFPIFFLLGLGLPALTLTGCKTQGASVDPGASVELPSKVEDFDAFVEGLNVLVRLSPDDPRLVPLRGELRDWVVPYVLQRLEDGAVDAVIERYTREAGVRELERRLSRIARKVAREVAARPTSVSGPVLRARAS